MLDSLVERARDRNIATIMGYYIPTAKNAMVKNFYPGLGFTASTPDLAPSEEATAWELDVATYVPQNTHIKIKEILNA